MYCRNSVHLVIRKVQYAPEKPGPQPMVETSRSFLMSDRSLHLEASLDKEVTHSHTLMSYLMTGIHTLQCLCVCVSLSSYTTMGSPSVSMSRSPTTPSRLSRKWRYLVTPLVLTHHTPSTIIASRYFAPLGTTVYCYWVLQVKSSTASCMYYNETWNLA